WFVAWTGLGWAGGNAGWARWGMDGGLWPAADGGLYRAAAGVAGLWFLVVFGFVAAYPLGYALSWGAVCYLRARQQTEGGPAGGWELSPGEGRAGGGGVQNGRRQRRGFPRRGRGPPAAAPEVPEPLKGDVPNL